MIPVFLKFMPISNGQILIFVLPYPVRQLVSGNLTWNTEQVIV